VTPDNNVTVALHPVVNSLTGILNGVPQISTRDTETVVRLKNDETLVIGGLIQESSQRTENKIPGLGDIPIVGALFKNTQTNANRNELIIVVTPHIIAEGASTFQQVPPLPTIPTPMALPTLPPGITLPAPSGLMTRVALPGTPAPMPNPATASPEQISDLSASAAPAPSATATARAGTSALGVVAGAGIKPNAYVYGQQSTSNVVQANDPVRILYAELSPTTARNGSSLTIVATTTSNAAKVSLSYGSVATSLGQIAPGQWQAVVPFSTATVPVGQTQIQLTLTAARADGRTMSILLPFSITPG